MGCIGRAGEPWTLGIQGMKSQGYWSSCSAQPVPVLRLSTLSNDLPDTLPTSLSHARSHAVARDPSPRKPISVRHHLPPRPGWRCQGGGRGWWSRQPRPPTPVLPAAAR